MIPVRSDRAQDAAIDALSAEHRLADGATTDVLASYAQQLAALRAEVVQQRAQIAVLTQALIERGVVAGADLAARYESAMAQTRAQASLVSCARCRSQVDKRRTQITAQGTLCDACCRALDADE